MEPTERFDGWSGSFVWHCWSIANRTCSPYIWDWGIFHPECLSIANCTLTASKHAVRLIFNVYYLLTCRSYYTIVQVSKRWNKLLRSENLARFFIQTYYSGFVSNPEFYGSSFDLLRGLAFEEFAQDCSIYGTLIKLNLRNICPSPYAILDAHGDKVVIQVMSCDYMAFVFDLHNLEKDPTMIVHPLRHNLYLLHLAPGGFIFGLDFFG